MFFELIAAVFAGVSVGGLVLLAGRLVGGVPRGLVPIAGGAAMIAFAIWSEYAWFDRMRAGLPDSAVVIASNESRAAWRPWTFVAPLTTRFAAVDPAAGQPLAGQPEMVVVSIRLVERWKPVIEVPVIVDCAGSRRADLVGVEDLDQARWVAMGMEDPLMAAVCSGQN